MFKEQVRDAKLYVYYFYSVEYTPLIYPKGYTQESPTMLWRERERERERERDVPCHDKISKNALKMNLQLHEGQSRLHPLKHATNRDLQPPRHLHW